MDIKETIELIEFFNKVSVDIKDVTNPQELQDGRKVVEAIYAYEDKTFTTKKLYYKDISLMDNIKNPEDIKTYFGSSVFWLDPEKHNWPTNENLNEKLTEIISDITDELEFQEFLENIYAKIKELFNQENRSQQKSKELVYQQNNNHLHDIVLLLKAFIDSKGNDIKNHYFSKIVYYWYNGERTELRSDRKLVISLQNIIKTTFKEIDKMKEFQNYLKLLEHKHQIILQGPPGTGKTRLAKEIAYNLITGKNLSIDKDQRDKELKELEGLENFKLIQFHPAYSYEDFVRGIVAKSTGNGIEYRTENKILGKLANLASSCDKLNNKEINSDYFFQKYKDIIINEIKLNQTYQINQSARISNVTEDKFKYGFNNGNSPDNNMRFDDILIMFNEKLDTKESLEANKEKVSGTAIQHATYFIEILKKFQEFIQKQNFILIIDEINRANLPAVLGELIYALEYRDQSVESMYDIDGDRKIVLPKNLYIIGTMNTADRSVGHIDYAIRRRFAFETIFPQRSVINSPEGQILFDKVADLFCKNYDENKKLENELSEFLSSDFLFQDVMIGHSYFMGDKESLKMKLEYEIKPILREYLKDGILLSDAKEFIDGLKC